MSGDAQELQQLFRASIIAVIQDGIGQVTRRVLSPIPPIFAIDPLNCGCGFLRPIVEPELKLFTPALRIRLAWPILTRTGVW
jgi:hypothetical protein